MFRVCGCLPCPSSLASPALCERGLSLRSRARSPCIKTASGISRRPMVDSAQKEGKQLWSHSPGPLVPLLKGSRTRMQNGTAFYDFEKRFSETLFPLSIPSLWSWGLSPTSYFCHPLPERDWAGLETSITNCSPAIFSSHTLSKPCS